MRIIVPVLAALLLAAPAFADGPIGTIARGTYVCELPGDVAGAVGIEQPGESFTILSASRYSSPQGSGTYLRRGDIVSMTSGPRNGTRYIVIGRDFVRKLDEHGEPSRLRCLRLG